jgi:beta-glucanase (GH16 family)
LEINAKYPVGNQLYWPAFWLWQNGNCHTSSAWDNEIDIAENLDSASYYGHETATNIHWGLPDSCTPYPNSQGIIKGLPRLDSIFHKYALEWDVNNLTFYFDDKPVRVVPNSLVPTPQHALNVSFGCGINPIYDPSLPKHKMPAGGANYIIDYFNYYTLNTDCQNVLTISNPSTDYYNPSPPHKARAVEQSITTTTVGSQSPTFNLSDNCTLRATNYIILGAGTTINATGTGHFAAIVTPCP